jgi:hypothetical protein
MANNNDKKKTNLIDSYNKNTTNKIVGLIDKNPKDWQQLIAPMVVLLQYHLWF